MSTVYKLKISNNFVFFSTEYDIIILNILIKKKTGEYVIVLILNVKRRGYILKKKFGIVFINKMCIRLQFKALS